MHHNIYYELLTEKDHEDIKKLVIEKGMIPIDVVSYYIHHLRQVEQANQKLVDYIGEEKALKILNKD